MSKIPELPKVEYGCKAVFDLLQPEYWDALGVEKPNDEYFENLDRLLMEEARHIQRIYSTEETAQLIVAVNNWIQVDQELLGHAVNNAIWMERMVLAILDLETPGNSRNGLPKVQCLFSNARALTGIIMAYTKSAKTAMTGSLKPKNEKGSCASQSALRSIVQYTLASFIGLQWGRFQPDQITMENMTKKLHFYFTGPVYSAVDMMIRLSGYKGDRETLAKLVIKLCFLQRTSSAYKNLFVLEDKDKLFCSEIAGRFITVPMVMAIEASPANPAIRDVYKHIPETLEDKRALVQVLLEVGIPEKTRIFMQELEREIREDLLPKLPENKELEDLLSGWTVSKLLCNKQ